MERLEFIKNTLTALPTAPLRGQIDPGQQRYYEESSKTKPRLIIKQTKGISPTTAFYSFKLPPSLLAGSLAGRR
jgi:hypothetical protein